MLIAFFLLHASAPVNERWQLITQLENLAYDTRLKTTMPGGVDRRIVIIDIDEKSLAEEGRWPWPRNRVAQLIDILFDRYEIGLLGMDVVWAEPDESSGLNTLEKLATEKLSDNIAFHMALDMIRPSLQRDRIFSESLKNRPIVLSYYFDTEGSENTTGKLPEPVFNKNDFSNRKVTPISASGYGANLDIFQDVATDAGHFNPYTDIDGIVRKIPMLIEYKDNYYSSLSLAVIRQIAKGAEILPGFAEGTEFLRSYTGLEWLSLGNYTIPVDAQIKTLIPYRGPKGSFTYLSATDILKQTVSKESLSGTIALLGASAPGLLDLRSTPVQQNFPGVEIHANMIAGFIDQNLKQNPAWALGAEFSILLIIGLSMGLLLPLMSATIATLLSLTIALLVTGFNYYLWQELNIALPIASSLLLIIGLYMLNMSYGFFIESREKHQLADIFGQYIPPELVDEMGDAPAKFSLQGDSREMTVMFSDVRGFTTISESLEPEDLQRLMNEFLTSITKVIHQHRGTIDKYMGDAVMAFWGAPLPDPDHAGNALHAALDIITAINELKPVFRSKGWPELNLGIGINSGVMRVGDMGSEFRRAYTVMGDAVNLGSRLEGLTKEYSVHIIVSEYTRSAVPDITYRELDKVKVKGKDKVVTIYEPLVRTKDLSVEEKNELHLYQQALQYYRKMNWDLAELQFLNLQKQSPECKLYRIYANRIAEFRVSPPDDNWDGVFTHLSK